MVLPAMGAAVLITFGFAALGMVAGGVLRGLGAGFSRLGARHGSVLFSRQGDGGRAAPVVLMQIRPSSKSPSKTSGRSASALLPLAGFGTGTQRSPVMHHRAGIPALGHQDCAPFLLRTIYLAAAKWPRSSSTGQIADPE